MFASPREDAVEKRRIPPVGDGSRVSCSPMELQHSFKDKMFDKRQRRRISENECHQQYTQETFAPTRCCPQNQYSFARQRHSNFYTDVHDNVPFSETDRVDGVFQLKPIYHKITPTRRTQDSLNPYEFEKLSVSSKPKGLSTGQICNEKPTGVNVSSREPLSNSVSDVTASQRPRRNSHRRPDEEQRLAKAIYEKELILQEKLLRLTEKLRNNIPRHNGASGDGRRQAERENKCPDIRGFPAERRELTARRYKTQEAAERQRKTQDDGNKDRINMHEGNWGGTNVQEREIVKRKPQPSRDRRAEEVKGHDKGASGKLNRWERESVKEKELSRRKTVNENYISLGGEISNKSQWEKEGAKEREQNNKVSEEDIDWNKEKKWERPNKTREYTERYGSSDDEREQDLPQKVKKKSAHRLATENHSGKERRMSGEPSQPSSASSLSNSSRLRVELTSRENADICLQHRPCKICHRKFTAERLEEHLKICTKLQQSHRKVFDSSSYRTKGTQLEDFLKSKPRGSSPEVKQITRNQRQARLPGGTLEPKQSIQGNYVTCPHCTRQFAPRPGERHIPKCQNIKSRPPPPRYRQ